MNIQGVTQAVRAVGPDNGLRALSRIEGPSFADSLKDAVGQIDSLQQKSRDAIDAFVRGEPVELHQVMAATEEAGIALDMLIEVRNKLVDAYRSVINMQG